MRRFSAWPLLVLFLLVGARSGFAQASGARVFEDLVEKTLHVRPGADEGGDGSPEKPYATIENALAAAIPSLKEDVGVKLALAPGIYRESIDLPSGAPDNSAPLVIEAEKTGQAIISGADVWDGWKAEGDGTYSHDWMFEWGVGRIPDWGLRMEPVVRRREIVFVDGKRLGQVMLRSELRPGTYFVDDDAKKLFVRPLPGVDPTRAVVEVGVRDRLIRARGWKNVVLRGLRLDASNAFLGAAATFLECRNLLISDCDISRNNATGLEIQRCSDVTIERSRFNDNGARGIGGAYLRNVIIDTSETSRNNWRGNAGGFRDWGYAGIKLLFAHGVVMRKHLALHNHTTGVWFAADNRDITLENCYIIDNQSVGLYLEASPGPFLVTDTEVRDNATGVFFSSTENVRLLRSTIAGNSNAQISLFSDWGQGRAGNDWETEAPFSVRPRNVTLRESVIVASAGKSRLFDIRDNESWVDFSTSLTAAANTYYDPDGPKSFFTPGDKRKEIAFAEWQKATKQDTGSKWAEAAQAGRPTVGVEKPEMANSLTEPARIVLTATAPAKVERMEFYSNRERLGMATAPPYQVVWENVPVGRHSVRAWAVDAKGKVIGSDELSVLVHPREGTHGLLREVWRSAGGQTVKELTDRAEYPNKPDEVDYLTSFETPRGLGENYGQRFRALLVAPVSGEYTFWIAADDECELWLSTDQTPANKKRIAYVSGYAEFRQYDKMPTQKSAAITLEAGKQYYIEALHKQGSSEDGFSVAWQGPEFERTVIEAGSLLVWRGVN